LPDQAAAALEHLSRREDYTAPGELAFCNVSGRPLDGSALRRRFKRARDAAGLRSLRFHELRHTYGSLLAAGGVDLVTIQAAMGHSALSTTSRYLHARPASEQAAVFTEIFSSAGEQLTRAAALGGHASSSSSASMRCHESRTPVELADAIRESARIGPVVTLAHRQAFRTPLAL